MLSTLIESVLIAFRRREVYLWTMYQGIVDKKEKTSPVIRKNFTIIELYNNLERPVFEHDCNIIFWFTSQPLLQKLGYIGSYQAVLSAWLYPVDNYRISEVLLKFVYFERALYNTLNTSKNFLKTVTFIFS